MTGRGFFACIALGLAFGSSALAAEAIGAPVRTPGAKFRECAECPEMIVVRPGSFTMGSPPSEVDREEIESPQRQVTIGRAFALALTHVTRADYARFARDTGRASGEECYVWDDAKRKSIKTAGHNWRDPGFQQTDNDPVVCVDYDDAHAYVDWLNDKVRQAQRLPAGAKPYRLPTEAEFEYAARAGATTRFWWGDNVTHEHANYGIDCPSPSCGPLIEGKDRWLHTAPVGSLPPNPFGLYDMAGNAWQWVEDCFEDSYAGAPNDGTARTSCTRPIKVTRGGAWISRSRYVRSAARDRLGPGFRAGFTGIRVARTLE